MFSPTAIADFLACRHLTALNRAAAAGEIKKPMFADPGLDLLIKLGLQHEEAYLRLLSEEHGLQISTIPTDTWTGSAGSITKAGPTSSANAVVSTTDTKRTTETKRTSWAEAAVRTIEAMRAGADVIYQAAFLSGQWYGRADFLRRVEKPSALGDWSYEVVETKLARSTKARAIIQLCFYSDLVAEIQGVLPDYMHVVLGGGAQPEKFSVQRYLAYFRKIRKDFQEGYAAQAATYPEPVDHCGICAWITVCGQRWREDDHLSLVAGITRNQRKVLVENRIITVAQLGALTLPPEPKIEGVGDRALLTIHEQARLQVQGRTEGRHVYDLLSPPEAEKGLCSLPPPSPGDVFLDFEGDPFATEQGLEYLFGVVTLDEGIQPIYSAAWALNQKEEKRVFEAFIAMVMDRRRRYPDMHIYHYGAYEETALKHMAGRHGVGTDEVDELLRGDVLVDLYRVVRQGLRASVESYSIKKLEPLYQFKREVQLVDANVALTTFQAVLAFGPEDNDISAIRNAIEGYNRDDCISTLRLRDWLEERRHELEASTGVALPRPQPKESEPTKDLSAYLQQVRAVSERLTASLPEDENEWTNEQRACWLLAQLLEWHRREEKSAWWEYFRLCELTDDQLLEDRSAMGGLVYEGEVGQIKKSLIHRYRFPLQDHSIDRARSIHDPKTRESAGTLVRIDERELTIDIKRGVGSQTPHPTALIPNDIFNTNEMRESLLRLGSWVADNGIIGLGAYQAARGLLLRQTPRLKECALRDFSGFELVEAAKQIGLRLDHTVLPVQGPPGSGKTYTGARMIVELVRSGKKVGVTAVSHKVISNLLNATCKAAGEENIELKIIQRCDGDDNCENPLVTVAKDNPAVVDALAGGEAQIAAGTVWLWSRSDMANAVDVLFVDEAGQMSLANVLAASQSTASIVLLGDPQQLDQPQRGVHPPGAEASALSHLLNGRATIGEEQGLFLAESWRLHPDICNFTSEVFYDGRLVSRPENSNQRLNCRGGTPWPPQAGNADHAWSDMSVGNAEPPGNEGFAANVGRPRSGAPTIVPEPDRLAGTFEGTGLRYVPVNHNGNQSDSPEEVEFIVEIVRELLRGETTWTNKEGQTLPLQLKDILIVAPYNAQVALLARRLPPGARVGTVDKFQGQEAPIVFYSMTTSTPEDAPRGMEFLYSSNRLNVATSRAQCVTVLVASPALIDVQCKTPRQIELANAFCRYLELAQVI